MLIVLGSTPFLRTLQRSLIMGKRSVYVKAKKGSCAGFFWRTSDCIRSSSPDLRGVSRRLRTDPGIGFLKEDRGHWYSVMSAVVGPVWVPFRVERYSQLEGYAQDVLDRDLSTADIRLADWFYSALLELSEVTHHLDQGTSGAGRRLVRTDPDMTDAAVVINGYMRILPAAASGVFVTGASNSVSRCFL